MISIAKQEMKTGSKQRGATMVEYAIMIGLIAVVAIAVIQGIGGETKNTFSTVNSALKNANTSAAGG